MPDIPYIAHDTVALAASSTGSAIFSCGLSEQLRIKRLWITSTAAFELYDIRDSAGFHYTNASESEAIPSAALMKPQTVGSGVGIFEVELVVGANVTLYIDLKDVSAAPNTIKIQLEGVKEVM
jgi:hypothetical protein